MKVTPTELCEAFKKLPHLDQGSLLNQLYKIHQSSHAKIVETFDKMSPTEKTKIREIFKRIGS